MNAIRKTALFLAALTVSFGPVSAASTETVPEVLDLGLRLASAIEGDPKDRARAQEWVVLDIAIKGAHEQAANRATEIQGWRQGVAYAEIAAMAAKAGRFDLAKELLAKARAGTTGPQGWEPSRVLAHVARAEALVGSLDSATPRAERLAEEDDQQYAGFPAIAKASAHAVRGEFDAAMAELALAGEGSGLELGWWRASAYLDLARAPGLTPEQRKKALDAAVAGTMQHDEMINRLDTLERSAEAYREQGFVDAAREVLEKGGELASRMPDSTVLKGSILAGQARVWARIEGSEARVRELLAGAETAAAKVPEIDRPAVLANIAAGHHAAGDLASTSRLLNRAISDAEALVNARPRALAAVEICRVMGRFDLPLDPPVRARLGGILKGLRAPW